MNKFNYTWDMFTQDCEILVGKIRRSGVQYKNIYGIPRGGLILATILSHQLNIPLILNKSTISSKTLVVDDISDSGETLKNLNIKSIHTATLWVSLTTKYTPTYHIRVNDKKEWIVFPFETLLSSKKDN